MGQKNGGNDSTSGNPAQMLGQIWIFFCIIGILGYSSRFNFAVFFPGSTPDQARALNGGGDSQDLFSNQPTFFSWTTREGVVSDTLVSSTSVIPCQFSARKTRMFPEPDPREFSLADQNGGPLSLKLQSFFSSNLIFENRLNSCLSNWHFPDDFVVLDPSQPGSG